MLKLCTYLFLLSVAVVGEESVNSRGSIRGDEDDDLSMYTMSKKEAHSIGYLPPIHHLLHVSVAICVQVF
jgi:hypothetical protein